MSAIATVVCHWKVCVVVVVIIVIVACTRICAHTKKIMKKKNIKIRYRIQQQQIPLHLRSATSKYVSHVKSQRKYKKSRIKEKEKRISVLSARTVKNVSRHLFVAKCKWSHSRHTLHTQYICTFQHNNMSTIGTFWSILNTHIQSQCFTYFSLPVNT